MKKKLKLKNNIIPVNTPKIYSHEKEFILRCLSSGWISSEGPFVKEFEDKFSKYNKRKFGIAVSNGTAALEIALKSFNLKKGDEVIIPAFSIISTALCVVKLGLKPILVDCDAYYWNCNIIDIKKKINKKTKAIILTHIYGFPIDLKDIISYAKKKKIKIIEDAAEVIGQKYKKKMCGSFGDISTFSFYANKHITTGEGGMILTNDKELEKNCRSLRNLSFGKGKNRFNHEDIGWNYRFTNLQAAFGLGQLKNIKWAINRKMQIGKLYYEKLKDNKFISIQKPKSPFANNIYWVFGLLIKKNTKLSRDDVSKILLKKKNTNKKFFFSNAQAENI